MLQQNPLLNETDLYEDGDPGTKRIPQQNSQIPQSSPSVHTLLSGIQYQYPNDPRLSQDI